MAFILAMAIGLLVLQTTLVPSLMLTISDVSGLEFLYGHTLDFALICLVYLVFHRDFLGAVLWASLFGILVGSFGMAWKGATTFSYFSIVLIGSFVKRQILLETKLAVCLMIAGFTLADGLIHLEAGHLFTQILDPFSSQWGTLVTQAVLNALVAPALYSFLFYFDGLVGGRSGRERTALLVDA